MNIEARKISIISWVSQLDNEDMLAQLENLQSQDQDWWLSISTEERKEIEEGLAQAERKELRTTDDVLAKYH